MTEEVKEKKEAAKAETKQNPLEKLKPMLALEPIFWNKWGSKLKANVQKIYYVLLGVFAVLLIKAFWDWACIGFGAFFIDIVVYTVLFFIVRLFAESLANN